MKVKKVDVADTTDHIKTAAEEDYTHPTGDEGGRGAFSRSEL